jgi:hypothetical protein
MKMALLGSLAIAATFTFAAPAEAYEGPWCLQYNLGRSSAERCHFTTFEGCAQERILQGTTAFCHQNPGYLPYWRGRGVGPEQPVKLARKKKHHRS